MSVLLEWCMRDGLVLHVCTFHADSGAHMIYIYIYICVYIHIFLRVYVVNA